MLEVGKGGLPCTVDCPVCGHWSGISSDYPQTGLSKVHGKPPYLEHADSVGVPESLAGYTVDLALKQDRDFLPKRKELCQLRLPGDQAEELVAAELHFYLWQVR